MIASRDLSIVVRDSPLLSLGDRTSIESDAGYEAFHRRRTRCLISWFVLTVFGCRAWRKRRSRHALHITKTLLA